jgi:hypothetical protein
VSDRITAMRETERSHIAATVEASMDMLDKAKQDAAIRARQAAGRDVLITLDTLGRIESPVGCPQELLLRQVAYAHPRSIWAMVRRQGRWYSLSLDLHISDGAADVARTWCRDSLTKLSGVLDLLENRPDLRDARGLVKELRDTVEGVRANFVAQARLSAEATVWSLLHADLQLWAECQAESGRGYRDRVVARLKRWFQEHQECITDFEHKVETAWHETVLQPLRLLCNLDTAE